MLSLLRIMTAALFVEHGGQKILGFPPTTHPAGGNMLIVVGGWIELIGGALLLLGLGTRFTAFILAGQMAVAYFMMHAPRGFFPVLNGGELAVLYCFVFLYFIFAGGGPLSLDALFRRRPAETEAPAERESRV
jgi:putative oxidoreductase